MSAPPSASDKRARTDEPQVRDLNALVEEWRGAHGPARFIPWFDPDGPGVSAHVLLLLESPGPATVRAGDLGFSSLDNQDPTTRRLRVAFEQAGVDGGSILRWNIVPWTSREAGRRAPRTDDLEEARPELTTLVDHLPDLRVVVTLGSTALEGWSRYLTLARQPRLIPTLAAPHPSPTNGHRREEALRRLVQALRLASSVS